MLLYMDYTTSFIRVYPVSAMFSELKLCSKPGAHIIYTHSVYIEHGTLVGHHSAPSAVSERFLTQSMVTHLASHP